MVPMSTFKLCTTCSILQTGYALLQTYAAHIHEEALRQSFLQNVAVHRELVAAYEGA